VSQYRVLIDANDEKGLVHKISTVFVNSDLNILSNSEFVDKDNNKFFMRSVVDGNIDKKELEDALESVLPDSATVRVIEPKKKNIVIMATKELHALGDILIRHESGELEANILAVVSNYDKLESLVSKFDIPYITISHENLERPEYEDKIINIHHSFLPAFIGANPYKQAYDRGVKIIGATSHFVNNNLDEGPIISQEVKNVDHAYGWKDMQRSGRDVEKIVLSRALKLALEDRIFVYANKTVIF